MKTEYVLIVVGLLVVAFFAGYLIQRNAGANTYATQQGYNSYNAPYQGGQAQNYPPPRPISGGGGCGV